MLPLPPRPLAIAVVVAFAGAAAAALSSCRSERQAPAIADEAAWRASLLADRAATDAEMRTSVVSPLAAIERHILSPSAPTYADVADAVRLGDQPDGAAIAFRPGDPWSWEPLRPDVTATGRDASTAIAPGPVTQPTVIKLGRFSLLAQAVDKTFVVSVYDAQAEALRAFTGVVYFAPDRRYAVSATIERFANPESVTLPTTIGLEKTFLRYATLRFAIDGTRTQLTAYKPAGSKALFIPFRDATSGKATYGAGRYLDLPEPDGDTILLDFNRAYSPMCAYSPAFNCPIPPQENHLTVAIDAGEKTYPH